MNTKSQEKPPAEIYTFLHEHFVSLASTQRSSSSSWIWSGKKREINCAFVNFGRALAKRLKFDHEKFNTFADGKEKECGGRDPHTTKYDYKHHHAFISDNNTPAEGSNHIELKMFEEPLWNYAQVIGIDANEANDVVKFCEDLQQNVVNAALNSPIRKAMTVMKLTELEEFQYLNSIINSLGDVENMHELNIFAENYDKKVMIDKQQSLKELLAILTKISMDYSNASKREISKNGIRLTHSGNEILQFGQILYETVQNLENLPKNSVKYDENEQLLTIPISFAKHLLTRLYEFLESNLTENSKISDDFDFVQTLQTVASESKELEAEKRQKSIKAKVNVKLFQMLFSLAIHLCFLIDEKEKLSKKYLPKFVFALKMCTTNTGFTKFYFIEYKIKIAQQSVKINLPNWNLPYNVFEKNEEELKMEKAEGKEIVKKLSELMELIKQKRVEKVRGLREKFVELLEEDEVDKLMEKLVELKKLKGEKAMVETLLKELKKDYKV
ncbi:hypothetical protein niasHS_009770 [Heterodera schachtii]|uniref:Uncharacterized protein n=1 Tax=Heterodera schachtii TaxID=97005 RepID=A0ABD2IYU9_HETSC